MLLPNGKSGLGLSSLGNARKILLAGVVLACGALAACTGGFQPMYASSEIGGSNVADNLRSIQFASIPGRVGQKIRNELIFAANGGASDQVERRYRLEVSIVERKSTALVARDGDSIGQTYQLSASFRLLRLSDGQPALIGTSLGRASLQRYSEIYANVRALRDAQDRAARTVARDLRSRLEAFLATEV